MPLTDSAAKNAKPKEKPYRLADAGGMYLEVSPAGGKWWRLKYRYGGKEKRISLGVYPEVTLLEAREKRDTARKLLKNGTDPGESRKAEKAEAQAAIEAEAVATIEREVNTFQNIAVEWFSKNSTIWASSYSEKVIGRLENHIFPWIGNRPIKEIETDDVLACLRRLEEHGSIETAQLTRRYVSKVFDYAIITKRATHDPAHRLGSVIKKREKGSLPFIKHPKDLAVLLRAMDNYMGTFAVRIALQVTSLTMVRPKELREMEWSEIDFEAGLWCIPAKKMKAKETHVVPLSRQVIGLLREIQPLTYREKFVFPSSRGASRPMSENTVNVALINLGYKDIHCAHGFRKTASTLLNEFGWNKDAIERQLAHKDKDRIRDIYNYAEYLPIRREMMQAWADYLDGLRIGVEVASIHAKQAK